MSVTTDAIEIIDHLQTDGISRGTAKELIDYMDKQRGGLATEQGLETLRQANKQDLEGLRQASKRDLQAEIEPLKRDINWIKWIGGLGFTVILAGMAALLTVMLYLHSDSKADMKELRADMKELRADTKELRADMEEIKELLQRGQR